MHEHVWSGPKKFERTIDYDPMGQRIIKCDTGTQNCSKYGCRASRKVYRISLPEVGSIGPDWPRSNWEDLIPEVEQKINALKHHVGVRG